MENDDGNIILKFCVACGKPIERTEAGYANHHCSESREAARKSAHTRAHDAIARQKPLSQRLDEGFEMFFGSEDDDE